MRQRSKSLSRCLRPVRESHQWEERRPRDQVSDKTLGRLGVSHRLGYWVLQALFRSQPRRLLALAQSPPRGLLALKDGKIVKKFG